MTSAIPWILFRATVVCAGRRALGVFAANPVVALCVGGVVVALPLLAALAGRKLGPDLAVALASEEALARSFALSVGFTSALAGAAVAALAPREALGPQLAAAPVSRFVTFLSVTALPLLLAATAVAALAVLFLLPFAAATPGGTRAAFVVLAGGAAAASLGAALGESAAGVARGSPSALVALAALGCAWTLATVAGGGDLLLGPLSYLAAALRAPAVPLAEPLGILGATTAAGLAVWTVGAARPVEPPPRSRVRSVLPVPRDPRLASFAVALKRAGRRSALRRHALGVAAVSAGGALLLDALLPVPPDVPFFFAGATATLGAAVLPLAAAGLDREADWLWRAVPERAAPRAVASSLALVLLAFALAALAVFPVALFAPVPAVEHAKLAVAGALTFAAALVAGTLVPWRGDRLPDQLASYAAFALVGIALWLVVSTAARNAPFVGLPERVATALAVPLVLVSSLVFVAARAERREIG